MTKNKFIYFLFFIVSTSVCLGVYIGEDSLGSGKHDYIYHLRFLNGFSENFFNTYNEFGMLTESYPMRNSPIFYMFFSIFLKFGLPLESLKVINLLILIPIVIYFIKCLEIKYPTINLDTKIYFISALMLSPTIRTLLAWPYPLLWALCFFLISVYFFLIFNKSENYKKKMICAYSNIFFLSLSAYFTPKFAVFSLFFFYNFFLFYKFKKETLKIVLLNIVLAIPAIYFIITKDYYLFNSEPFNVASSTKYNLSNKIIIISSMFFLFFLPFITKENLFNKKNFKINYKSFILIIFITINIYFFDFLIRSGSGGGIFFQLSNILFENSLFLFIIFIFSLGLFGYLGLYNLNNILLFVLLLIYNLEFTIYYKYFDPLILFLLLFLTNYSTNNFIKIKKLSKKVFLFYIFFLTLNLSKSFIIH
ncbi:hypothetical protein N9S39_02250 [Candidatus Pelagibacter sp.]|nr:hypothetical protein [Candidatus Pelagibacter sp.]